MGNRFLTFLSNMLTDLNLSDMETCYKVFRRDVIQNIEIQENRFGFEPEVVAKLAQRRLRIYEMGISYRGRTYAEGKKIGMKDGWRALVPGILKYNLHRVPWPIQFGFYLLIGGISAIVNLGSFLLLLWAGVELVPATLVAFTVAAALNYCLSILILFRHRARWSSGRVGPVCRDGLRDRAARCDGDPRARPPGTGALDCEGAGDGDRSGPQFFREAVRRVP